MPLSDDADLVETTAQDIYCDSYTQYGTCTPERWKKTSESQREFFRGLAKTALDRLEIKLKSKGWKSF